MFIQSIYKYFDWYSEKTDWENFQPTKNQSDRVKKIHEEVDFIYAYNIYHVRKEVQKMGGSVKTETGDASAYSNQKITYSNYKKVK